MAATRTETSSSAAAPIVRADRVLPRETVRAARPRVMARTRGRWTGPRPRAALLPMRRRRRMEPRPAAAISRGIRTGPVADATGVGGAAAVAAAAVKGLRAIRMPRRRRIRRARASVQVRAKATIGRAIVARGRQGSRGQRANRPPVAEPASRVPRVTVRRARAAGAAAESRAVAIVIAAVVVVAGAVDRAAPARAVVAAQIRAAVRRAAAAPVTGAVTAADRAAAGVTPAVPAAVLLAGSNRLLAGADRRDRREIRQRRVVLFLLPRRAAVGQDHRAEIADMGVAHG